MIRAMSSVLVLGAAIYSSVLMTAETGCPWAVTPRGVWWLSAILSVDENRPNPPAPRLPADQPFYQLDCIDHKTPIEAQQ